MEIAKTTEDKKLTVALKGRLDTTTAPMLEDVINNELTDVDQLIFDFTDLDYISSAGLRVLLAAQKAMSPKDGRSMKLTHVKEEVMSVFEITGFADILTIE